MKKLLAVSAIAVLGLSSVAFAGGLPEEMPAAPMAASTCCGDSGVYLGVGAGYGLSNWNNYAVDTHSVDHNSSFIGRVFLGYDINRFFAAELGYDYFFTRAKYYTTATPTNYTHYRTQAVDLLAKGKLPVTDDFNLFAKVGISYLMSNASNGGTYTSKSPKTFNVAYGAGMDYCITPNVVASLEWLRANGHPKTDSDYQPYADMYLVGLRYKFDL